MSVAIDTMLNFDGDAKCEQVFKNQFKPSENGSEGKKDQSSCRFLILVRIVVLPLPPSPPKKDMRIPSNRFGIMVLLI